MLLDAVAVVHVDVDVGDLLGAVGQQPPDRHGHVVVDAEAAGPVGHRVVQAAGDVGGVVDLTGPHLAGRLDARADDVAGGLVHVARRSGCRRCRARSRGSARDGSALARHHRLDQRGLVHGGEVVLGGVRCGHARQPVEYAELARPARRSGRPGSGSSGGSARSRRRSATRRTPGRRGRSARPCAGRYSPRRRVPPLGDDDPVGLRHHARTRRCRAAARSPARPAPVPARSGCRSRSTRPRRSPRRAAADRRGRWCRRSR